MAGKDQEVIFGHAILILMIPGHPSSSQTWLHVGPCPHEGGQTPCCQVASTLNAFVAQDLWLAVTKMLGDIFCIRILF